MTTANEVMQTADATATYRERSSVRAEPGQVESRIPTALEI